MKSGNHHSSNLFVSFQCTTDIRISTRSSREKYTASFMACFRHSLSHSERTSWYLQKNGKVHTLSIQGYLREEVANRATS